MTGRPHRALHLIWIGRVIGAVILVGLVVYFVRVGLDKADKLASCLGLGVAVLALLGPYLLPPGGADFVAAEPDVAEETGDAKAAGGGQANTGVESVGDRSAQVRKTGAATAQGPGSVANTGVVRKPDDLK